MLLRSVTLLALATLPLCCFAEVGGDRPMRAERPWGEKMAENCPKLFDKIDSNDDGKIDEAEAAAAKAEIQARSDKLKTERPELFAKLDKNDDGVLDKGEFVNGYRAWRHYRGETLSNGMMDKFDTDGDGKLSDAEKDAAKEAMAAKAAQLQADHPELYARIDKNADGQLSREELADAWQARKAMIRGRADSDHDGKLSPDEKAAAKEKMEKVRERGGERDRPAERERPAAK